MKRGYKIYYCFLILVIIGAFFGFYKILEEKDVPISSVRQAVVENSNIDKMIEDDGSRLRKLYNINKYDVEDFIYFAPQSNMDANEILILKFKSKDDIENIKTKINERIEKQSNSFKNYDVEQYEIISNNILEQKGQYIILIVSEDSKHLKQCIDELF